MITANLIDKSDGLIIVQIEYEVDGTQDKNFGISGIAYLPHSWRDGKVVDRDFLVNFSSNWECETVMRFMGEDYETDRNGNTVAYYQTGSVHDLVNISRAMFLIHRLLEKELAKTNTYMYEEDNEYAKRFNIFDGCDIEIIQ